MTNIPLLPLSFAVILISLLITVIVERRLIPWLSSSAEQPIYEGGPSWHICKKGTPTMGGLAFIPAILLPLLLCGFISFASGDDREAISMIISLIFIVASSLIGIFDDALKLMRKRNGGLTPMQKLLLQSLVTLIFLMARGHFLSDNSIIAIANIEFDLGLLYYPFAILLSLGVVNCANLTDGVDGLASSVSLSAAVAFLFIGLASGAFAVSGLASALIGCSAGFLVFNRHPAKIFMGDTGSLMLGAVGVSLAFASQNPASILFMGGVYVIEGISVILQVIVYKLTGRRLFKMAPLHHHLEKCGYSENTICIMAVVLTFTLSAIGILVLRF